MMQARNLGLLLALSSVVMLPACSMFGGDNGGSRSASAARQGSAAPPPPDYSQQQQTMAQQPLTPDTVRQVQQTLQQHGMYRGRVDGVWGPATQAALRSYQQQNNLNASGQLDQQTMAALNLGNDQSGQNYGNNRCGHRTTRPTPTTVSR